jgi:hypothetical protein
MKRTAIGLGLISAFVFALALSASPQLHERVHADSNQSQHECAVTLIGHGNCDDAVPAPIVDCGATPIASGQVLPFDLGFVAPLFLSARIFEHAPPA